MRFPLSQCKAWLSNVNARSELHGDERQPAGDLKFKVDVPNKFLEHFHPSLRALLFFNDIAQPKDLAEQGLESNPDHLPHLRFPGLVVPLKWNDSQQGGTLTIHHGVGGRSDMVLEDIKVNAFSLFPKAGGTVEIEFRIQAKPDEKQWGKLCNGMIQTEVTITIAPPAEQAQLPVEPAAAPAVAGTAAVH